MTDSETGAGPRVQLGALDSKLGIEVLELSVERVVARMPVRGNTQRFGRLHGGATMVLGELLGSLAASLHAERRGMGAVGVEISATHLRPARGGAVTGVATPLHLGSRLTTHEITVTDQDGRRVAAIRATNCLIPREQI